jgi:hypothetical protein
MPHLIIAFLIITKTIIKWQYHPDRDKPIFDDYMKKTRCIFLSLIRLFDIITNWYYYGSSYDYFLDHYALKTGFLVILIVKIIVSATIATLHTLTPYLDKTWN